MSAERSEETVTEEVAEMKLGRNHQSLVAADKKMAVGHADGAEETFPI